MRNQRLLLTAAALSLGFSALPGLAASSSGDTKGGAGGSMAQQQDCKGLKGAALSSCLKQQNAGGTPGRSDTATSREGGRTPGRSEESASRTGTAPGKMDPSPLGAPAAGGTPKGGGSSPKK